MPTNTFAADDTFSARVVARVVGKIAGRWWIGQRLRPRAFWYPLIGLGLAVAAFLGLLLAHAIARGSIPSLQWAGAEIARAPVAYAYVGLSSGVALPALGLMLGQEYEASRRLSVTDPLTGLYNRRHFGERLAAELARGMRYDHVTSLLCLDLDRLKAINDDQGHGAGDRALQAMGRIIVACTRASDVVSRIGGDEFAVLLPETSSDEALALSERILAEAAGQTNEMPLLRISIGAASTDLAAEVDTDGLLAAADSALYLAKARGGCQAVLTRTTPRRSGESAVPDVLVPARNVGGEPGVS